METDDDYRYFYSRDSGYCDRKVFEKTLADTLVWMWRDYLDLENAFPIMKMRSYNETPRHEKHRCYSESAFPKMSGTTVFDIALSGD